jgi:cytochrome c oxidase assembly protein subunit 15
MALNPAAPATATPLVDVVDFSPTLKLLLLAAVFALLPLSWWWLRQRAANPRARLAALTALTLFLTFDLIVFGSFTRLSDSGLGCPDWPGCYGEASPFGARQEIHAEESATPTGPVTWKKAWIEMIHRYLAMTVGALILVMTAAAWRWRRATGVSPWWPTAALVWVIVQGLFGKYTVTLKLYPLIVTLHLLGGLALLALLAVQRERFAEAATRIALAPATRVLAFVALAVLVVQVASGGWVSSNYAVLACTGVPQCSGQWWPEMDFVRGFTLLRERGADGQGGYLGLPALMAIHMTHRLLALLATAVLLALAWRLRREARARGFGRVLVALVVAQVASGLSNVVLGWPLLAALAHSAGAAALVLVLTTLLARSRAAGEEALRRPAPVSTGVPA